MGVGIKKTPFRLIDVMALQDVMTKQNLILPVLPGGSQVEQKNWLIGTFWRSGTDLSLYIIRCSCLRSWIKQCRCFFSTSGELRFHRKTGS